MHLPVGVKRLFRKILKELAEKRDDYYSSSYTPSLRRSRERDKESHLQ